MPFSINGFFFFSLESLSLPPSPRPFATLHSLGLDLGVGVPEKVVVFWASNKEETARAIVTLKQRCFMQVLLYSLLFSGALVACV